jgi:SAM-dependent methyltransferase
LLARHLPEVHFIGVDITPKIVGEAQSLAKSLGISNVEFVEGDALGLPFEDSSFDATVCQTVLIHVSQAQRAIEEMSRVLKKGGTFMAAEYHTLYGDTPIDAQRTTVEGEEGMQIARYSQMIIDGYRKGGHGDLKAGGKVPFIAIKAGLQIKDIRINDRVAHAFPPYSKQSEQAALTEAASWAGLFQDPSYRIWLSTNMLAAGGSESDVDHFLELIVTKEQREAFTKGAEANYAFLWLINPVLLVTVARKP